MLIDSSTTEIVMPRKISPNLLLINTRNKNKLSNNKNKYFGKREILVGLKFFTSVDKSHRLSVNFLKYNITGDITPTAYCTMTLLNTGNY